MHPFADAIYMGVYRQNQSAQRELLNPLLNTYPAAAAENLVRLEFRDGACSALEICSLGLYASCASIFAFSSVCVPTSTSASSRGEVGMDLPEVTLMSAISDQSAKHGRIEPMA